MNKYFFLFTFSALLTACGGSSSTKTNQDSTTKSQTLVVEQCDCNELQIDSLGNHFKSDKPFTGICISYYAGSTDKYLEKNILNGLLHGKVEYFDRSGESILQEFYANGKLKKVGDEAAELTCDCNDLEVANVQGVSIYKLDDLPFNGTCEKYYAGTEQLYMESNYTQGVLDGSTIYYNRDGSIILTEEYDAGVLINAGH